MVADGDALVRKPGEPVFLDHVGNPPQLHVIFADGTALELIIDRESELTFEGPHGVLVVGIGLLLLAWKRPEVVGLSGASFAVGRNGCNGRTDARGIAAGGSVTIAR